VRKTLRADTAGVNLQQWNKQDANSKKRKGEAKAIYDIVT
jgi:hypothetical protein